MNETELKKIVANNITEYRKQLNLTQFELAKKLNYSDKSVSKWERAEALPDIIILKNLSDLFGITVDRLLSDTPDQKSLKPSTYESRRKKIIISTLAVLTVFFVATVNYCLLTMSSVSMAWMSFIFAIPASAVLLIIFSSIWKKSIITTISVSLLSWSIALLLFLLVNNKSYLFFIIAAAFQVIIIFWHFLKSKQRGK